MRPTHRTIRGVDTEGSSTRNTSTMREELNRILQSALDLAGLELERDFVGQRLARAARAQAFFELLLTLWHWIESAVLRVLPAAIDPPQPPGRLVTASCHVSRGPNTRVTSNLVVREELAVA